MVDDPLRICLLGHSTRSDNLGVGALTVSQIDILRDLAGKMGRALEITILDSRGARAPYVSGPDIKIVDLDRKFALSPSGLLARARRSDMVIDIGAGDSFTDIYGAARLRRMFLVKAIVHASGTPFVLAPQTIGPFTKPISRRLARASMARSALVASRDRLSTQHALELGIDGVIEASDVALRLPYDRPATRNLSSQPKVGINVSGLLMGSGYTGQNEFGIKSDYPTLIRDMIRFFQGEGAEVHLVAHVLPEAPNPFHPEDDYAANTALAAEFPDVITSPRFATPSEAKSYIAGLDFFTGARMHACIAAFSSGVPVIPMAYSRKFEGLFGTIGYDKTADCTSEDAETIKNKIFETYAKREAAARSVKTALAIGLKKLDAYEEGLLRILEYKTC